jgi:DNA-binding transcriptional regulator YiaG
VTGDELRALRRKTLKLSQAKLAGRLGVAVTTVARWERDERPIGELAERFVRLLAEIQTKAPSDLAARVAHLLAAPRTDGSTQSTRKRKRRR